MCYVRASVRLGLGLGGGATILQGVTRDLFNNNNFATSVALAEVCALLSVILVIVIIFFSAQGISDTEGEEKIG